MTYMEKAVKASTIESVKIREVHVKIFRCCDEIPSTLFEANEKIYS